MSFNNNNFNLGNLDNNKYINTPKIVEKPWGKEIWLALNDKYCYKRIEIKAGFKTSYQYHNYKLETNYIIKGNAEVWLENDDGIVEKFYMKEGDFFTVIPPKKHRVIAISDVILQEVSTPEVDDVIRINDEFNRLDGKIEEEHSIPVVCIIAAGTGSRLGEIGKKCHKTLLPYKEKSILSHIIDKFSLNTEIVIAVGYLKEQIIEYISLFHSDRKIKFVNV
jgi:mannose-6-phosphate isomerase-like protein (cupin superfamily)